LTRQRGIGEAGEVAETTTDSKSGWKRELQAILDKHAGTRDNGNIAAFKTRKQTCDVIFTCIRTLREVLGFRIDNPRNLDERHVTALVAHWYRKGQAPSTMRQNLSLLRKFARWIAKPGLVKSLPAYLPHADPADLRTSSVLKRSKSWSENGIDVDAKIADADDLVSNEKTESALAVGQCRGWN
jgi:hypothetical protein